MMENTFKQCLWKNFSAAIEMLSQSIDCCPVSLWEKRGRFYYLAYHTVIFLDYYLSHPVGQFQPQLPYRIVKPEEIPLEALDDVMPLRHYDKAEVRASLPFIQEKCKAMTHLDNNILMKRWIAEDEIGLHGLCPALVEQYSVLEILFYNFRHVQHHVAQMNLLLRQETNAAPDWVA
jgi:hypothetical protein